RTPTWARSGRVPRRSARSDRSTRVPRLHDVQRVMPVIEVEHPLVQHKLSYLRDRNTPTVHFRKLVNEVTLLLTYEATKDMPTEDVEVETPLEVGRFPRISGKKVAVCPIL